MDIVHISICLFFWQLVYTASFLVASVYYTPAHWFVSPLVSLLVGPSLQTLHTDQRTNGLTDRPKDAPSYRDALSQLKRRGRVGKGGTGDGGGGEGGRKKEESEEETNLLV